MRRKTASEFVGTHGFATAVRPKSARIDNKRRDRIRNGHNTPGACRDRSACVYGGRERLMGDELGVQSEVDLGA